MDRISFIFNGKILTQNLNESKGNQNLASVCGYIFQRQALPCVFCFLLESQTTKSGHQHRASAEDIPFPPHVQLLTGIFTVAFAGLIGQASEFLRNSFLRWTGLDLVFKDWSEDL